jgi:membrane-associated protease RseP (regulator of RpoE activity)
MKLTTIMVRAVATPAVLVLGVAAQASAQCPGNAPRVGDIGITRIECDCDIARPDAPDEWAFRTEPVVTRIAAGSAADGRLQVGDRILLVDGQPVTSRAGASAFARLHPSRPVALTVSRDGAVHEFLVHPVSVCANSPSLLGMSPATQQVRVASGAATPVQRGTPTRTADTYSIRGTPARTPAPAAVTTSGVRVPPTRTAAWVGIAFHCDDCSVITERGAARWSFSTPPEVYSVEPGSPAHEAGIRRGDIITHVDNHAITSTDGGRRWASLEPGATVRVRYRRGNDAIRTATFQAGKPRGAFAYLPSQSATVAELRALEATLVTRDSATSLLRSYEQTLRRQATEQERVLKELERRLSSGNEAQRRAAQTMLQAYLRQHERQQQELQSLHRETERLRAIEAERSAVTRRALVDLTSKITPATAVQVQPTLRASELRLRYSGTVRNTEVEVRGTNAVVVTERGNELIITTQDARIVVRVPDRE